MSENNLPEKFPNFVIFKTVDGKLVCRKSRHTSIVRSEEQI